MSTTYAFGNDMYLFINFKIKDVRNILAVLRGEKAWSDIPVSERQSIDDHFLRVIGSQVLNNLGEKEREDSQEYKVVEVSGTAEFIKEDDKIDVEN